MFISKEDFLKKENPTVQDAIALFGRDEKGNCYNSCRLMLEVIPEEFMDSEEFFDAIIGSRSATTNPTIISYATSRLKANPRLAFKSIFTNHSLRGLYHTVLDENKEIVPDEYSVIKNVTPFGDMVAKEKRSILLEDERFITKILDTAKKVDIKNLKYAEPGKIMYRLSNMLMYDLCEHSETFVKSDKFMEQAVDVNPLLLANYQGPNKDKLLVAALKSMLKQNFPIELDASQSTNKELIRLTKLCNKIVKLPENANIRKAIYKKIAETKLKNANTNKR